MRGVTRLLWWLLSGTAGGFNRGRILSALFHRPQNANELATNLGMDYKTIRHHLKVLKKNNLITTMGSGYGTMYFPSDLLQNNKDKFDEIWSKIGKKHK